MKNMLKTIAALGMTVSMVLTSLGGIQVLAAEPTGTYSETFDSFTENTGYTNSSGQVAFRTVATNIQEGLFSFQNVKGFAGKSADDGAIKMGYHSGITVGNGKAETTLSASLTPTSAPQTTKTGEFYEVSFDYAYDGNNADFEIRRNDNWYSLIKIRGGQIQTAFSSRDASGWHPTINGSIITFMEKNTWYRIRLLAERLDSTMNVRVYINDALCGRAVTTHAMPDNMTALNLMQFADSNIMVGATTAQTDLPTSYVDNVKISTYATDPTIDVPDRATYTMDGLSASSDKTEVQSSLTAAANREGFYSVGAMNLVDNDQTAAMAKIQGGVFGKAADDQSIYLYKDYQNGQTTRDQSHFVDLVMHGCNVSGTPIPMTVNQGEYSNIEVYMAYDGSDAESIIQGFYAGLSGQDGKASASQIYVRSNGQVTAFNSAVPNVTLKKNCWYKFNLVIHAGSNAAANDADKNWYKLYINNTLVKDQTVFVPTGRNNATLDSFSGFGRFWLQSLANTNPPTDRPMSGSYFDDFSVTNYKSEPTFAALPQLTYSTAYAQDAMNGGMYGYVGSQMKDATVSAEGATVTVVDPNGTEKTAFSGGTDYIRVIRNGVKYFGMADSSTYTDIESHDFGATTNIFVTGAMEGAISGVKYTTFGGHTPSGSVAGKGANDSYFTIATNDMWRIDDTDNDKNNGDVVNPFVTMNVGGSGNQLQKLNAADTCTIEVTLRGTGDYNMINVQLRSTKGTNNAWQDKNAFMLHNDGRILRGNALTVIGRYHKGEWTKLAATIYPKTNKLYLYINGQCVGSEDLWDTNHKESTLARLKIEAAHWNAKKSSPVTSEVDIDDVHIYNGAYQEKAAPSLSSEAVAIYNTGGVIFTQDKTYQNAAMQTAHTAKSPVIYTDAALTTEAADFADGAVLALPNDSGDTVKYYYVATGAPTAQKQRLIHADGSAVTYGQGTHNYRVRTESFVPTEKVTRMFTLAEIDGNELLKAGTVYAQVSADDRRGGDVYGYPVVTNSGTFTMTIEKADSTLKLFAWENMKPITDEAAVISR